MNVVDSRRRKKRNGKKGGVSAEIGRKGLGQKRDFGVGRGDTNEEREYECHRIMVGADMVKGC